MSDSEPAGPTATRWEVELYRDGERVTPLMPVTAWEAATIGAQVVLGLAGGGTVSVGAAVADERVRDRAPERW